ncbi:hypothetical protein [Hymenobacter coccineus]|uniref:STAS/SEC14 domain-containing protein n=1 Tax=Hymenobacter coccineus TaxID=1908235 RepID=A0A1G1TM12_9BACT|nr:hypothetical protein [Hymenobacter coccineus]OGX91907.1 hypothetical protein BEN49_17845 [Hymenobacter coccineus]
MLPDPFSTPCLQVVFRPDLGQLTGRWLRSVTEAELHAGYGALREAALHHGCGHWLIDSRRRTNRSLNGPEWVTTAFLPEVQRALGAPLNVCFLVLPDYLQSLPAAHQGPAPGSLVQFARFVDEGAANAWLAART